MTYTIDADSLQTEQFAFTYSPIHEVVHSLRVLTISAMHPLHLPWVLRMRQQMPPALKAEVAAFGILFRNVIPDIFPDLFPLTMTFPTFEDEMLLMEQLAPDLYAEHVIHSAVLNRKDEDEEYTLTWIRQSRPLYEQILAQTAEKHPASVAMIKELILAPEESQKRLFRFFVSYWQTCMLSSWAQLEASLLQDIQQRGQILFNGGVLEMLQSLAPQLHVSQQDAKIVMQYPSQTQRNMQTGKILLLIPSAYVWPRLLFIYEGNTLIAIVYAINQMQEEGLAPVAPNRLLKLLRALGDNTRLQIIQLLSQRARSTRELAGILSLTEAGISKHLEIYRMLVFYARSVQATMSFIR